ncbi:MAG: hypothetical protein ACI364_06400 [Coriobacteriales bacterium]
MYHQATVQTQRARRRRLGVVLAAIAACAIVVALLVGAVRASAREQGAVNMRDAIVESAKQCCAVEGSYPTSYQYLEDHYGLRVNERDYVITYESFASNVLPNVVVVPR